MSNQPGKWKMAILTWVAIYPTITVLLLFVGPILDKIGSVAIKTMLLTAMVVPFMVILLMPALMKRCRSWLDR